MEAGSAAVASVLSRSQAQRRRRVVDAAMVLAAEGGYDAVQMRDVSTRGKVALGTIYRYFSSKDHLLSAVQVEWLAELERRMAQRPPRGETSADRVVDLLRRASRAIEREPLLAAALIRAQASPEPEVAGCQAEVSRIMEGMLTRAIDPDELDSRPGVVRVLTHVWFSLLVSWVNGRFSVTHVGDELEIAVRLVLPA